MRKYITTAGIGLILILGIYTNFLISKVDRLKKNNDRLTTNQEALLSDMEVFKTKDSLNGVNIKVITLLRDELFYKNDSLKKEIKALNLKIDDLSQIQTVETIVKFKGDLLPVNIGNIPCYEYKDNWSRFTFCDSAGSVRFNGVVRNRLEIYIHEKYEHRWWFIKWGRKIQLGKIISRNTNCEITSADLKIVNR